MAQHPFAGYLEENPGITAQMDTKDTAKFAKLILTIKADSSGNLSLGKIKKHFSSPSEFRTWLESHKLRPDLDQSEEMLEILTDHARESSTKKDKEVFTEMVFHDLFNQCAKLQDNGNYTCIGHVGSGGKFWPTMVGKELNPGQVNLLLEWITAVGHTEYDADMWKPKLYIKNFSIFSWFQVLEQLRNMVLDLRHSQDAPRGAIREFLTHFEVESPDIAEKALKHTLWLIKRKARRQEIKFDMMLILRSIANGTGKTECIRRLLAPLGRFHKRDASFTDILDARQTGTICSRYAAIQMDELAALQKSDMEQVKKLITQDKVAIRLMYTNTEEEWDKIATFVGTSNRPISELFKDPTGNRRFFELVSNVTVIPSAFQHEEGWQEGGSKWIDMWREVDEKNTEGYLNLIHDDEAKDHMAQTATKTPAMIFLEECFDIDSNVYQQISTKVLFQIWKEYAKDNEEFKLNHTAFTSNIGSALTVNPKFTNRDINKGAKFRVPTNSSVGPRQEYVFSLPLFHADIFQSYAKKTFAKVDKGVEVIRYVGQTPAVPERSMLDAELLA